MSNLIDYITGISAAASAGKLPSTKQANDMADWLLKSPLIQTEQSAAGSGGKLSEHGEAIARDLREIVQAYQAAAVDKNGDDMLQDALYELARAQSTVTKNPDESEGARDATDFVGAAKLVLEAALGHFGAESGEMGGELASFTRLTAADVAEAVESQAGAAKEKLRQTEDEVQAGNRDPLGRRVDDPARVGEADARQKFERRMDAVKNVGGQTIGTAQDAKGRSEDIRESAIGRLDDATFRIAERAQNDPEYRRSVDTLFSIYRKYLDRSIDRAQDVKSEGGSTSIEAQLAEIVQDPTGRVPVALSKLRTLIERFAGGYSLDKLLVALAACASDIREDHDVRMWFDEYEAFVRKSMDEPGYLRSTEWTHRRDQLHTRWTELKNADTAVARKWSADVDRFRGEQKTFSEAVKKDGSLRRLQDAHVALGRHLMKAAPTAGKALTGQASWVWTDLTEVILPRVFSMLKLIPLPRTEYVDAETEFVLENVSLESLQVLPGHVKISNTTDLDIDAPSSGQVERDVSTKTRIQFTGVQLTLSEVSFYYRDKGGAVKTVTGLLDVTIPQKGVDMDITLGLLPTASGAAERRKRTGFHNVESVKASLDDVKIAIRQSNHQVLLSVFKPVFRTRLVSALREALEGYTRLALEAIDGIAYDVHQRARVVADAGVPLGPSYITGLMSELGYLARQTSVFAGMRTTSVGIVKDDEHSDKAFAVGAGPQVLGAEKHGPYATGTQPTQTTTGAKGPEGDVTAPAVPSIESFADSVARKREVEQKSQGWRTRAFDVPPYVRNS